MRKTAEQIKIRLGNDQNSRPARDFGRHGGTIGKFRTGNSAHNFEPCGTRECAKSLTAFAKTGASLGGKSFREGNSRTMLAPVLPWFAFFGERCGPTNRSLGGSILQALCNFGGGDRIALRQ